MESKLLVNAVRSILTPIKQMFSSREVTEAEIMDIFKLWKEVKILWISGAINGMVGFNGIYLNI
jgi:hypothetical protein